MKKYTFRLATVLQHRERLEDHAKQQFAEVQRRLAAEIRVREALQHEFETISETLRREHASLDSDELRMHYARVDFLSRSMLVCDVNIERIRAEQNFARAHLLKTSQDRRVLETLDERGRTEHAAEALRHELAQLDDANSRRIPLTLEPLKELS